MESKISDYNFQETYEQEWEAFITQFPKDEELNEASTVYAIKASCRALNAGIQTLYEHDSSYSTQMELYFSWSSLRRIAEESDTVYTVQAVTWFARQLMNMIVCDNSEIVESIWYAIAVNYFECGNNGAFLFEKMYDGLPEEDLAKLIKYSISIPWKDKVQTYQKICLNKEHHEMLGDALFGSCNAYCFGSAKASEAVEILNQLEGLRAFHYESILTKLTTPIPTEVQQIVCLEKATEKGIFGFVAVKKEGGWPTWFPYAALWIGDEYIGTFDENCYDLSWDTITYIHKIEIKEEEGRQDLILAVKIPIQKDWLNQVAELRPI